MNFATDLGHWVQRGLEFRSRFDEVSDRRMQQQQSDAPATNASFRERGGWWVIGQLVLMALVITFGFAFSNSLRWPGLVWLGAGLMILGGGIALAGSISLGRRLTPFPKPQENSQLTRRGVYSLMRHPLYTSVMVTAIGWALFRHSWTALAGALVLALFLDAKARREERWLRSQFPDYAEYQRQVRRFVPWVY